MATINTQGYASDVVVGSALPQDMNFQLPASLPAAKNFEMNNHVSVLSKVGLVY